MLGVTSIHLPPPIDTDFFRPINKELAFKMFRNFPLDESEITFSYLGNLTPSRLPPHVFIALRRLLVKHKIKFTLLLLAPKFQINYRYYDNLTGLIERLNLTKHVFLSINNLNEEKKLALYNISDVFLFLALTPEAIDPLLTVLEAMSCGRIVLATPVQSLPHMIHNMNNGILINPCSLDQYCSILVELCKDIDSYRQIGMNARRSILNSHSFSVISQKIRKLHHMLMT
jgi:glycosyltransferase involved in cell wall biosynthesis